MALFLQGNNGRCLPSYSFRFLREISVPKVPPTTITQRRKLEAATKSTYLQHEMPLLSIGVIYDRADLD